MSVAEKKIASIRVVKAGSAPDVDSDFHTAYRDLVLEHCEELYGRGTLANIVTFSTLAAKAAFKTMCTIYSVPFAQANKIAALIPGPIEGVDCTIDDIFNPASARYSECGDFRTATAGEEWKKVLAGAKAIEGRVRATGVHPCGIIISSKPLIETIPLQVRQTDQRVISQWTYKELESLGLLKFDFLGLDTVDLIALTVEYIQKSGKTPPNMLELIHGPMDDRKTFEMLGRGETDGIFQLASPGVKDLLRRMKPTELGDIVATTALYRPGPMGMNSHIKYADRKNGREKVEYPIHPDFKNSPLEKILEQTYSLVVYQEQIMQIANQIGGMTLQQGDDLRSAMGKKKKDVMARMKPIFVEGGLKNGYSEEAIQQLWATMEVFAEYGFNKAHSVAYAMNAYQAAYLKANYRVEFMAALISQNIGRKEKILAFLQEAKRMGLKVGSADINLSDIRVAPDYTGKSKFDIVYGLSGINAVSTDMARLIVNEREKNGEFKSIQDVITRCSPLGVTNKKIYENLALAGAFDSFGFTRRGIIENLSNMLGEAKTQSTKGATLFDMMGGAAAAPASVDLNGVEEFPHLEKLKKESDVIGLYLTSHPLANVGSLAGLRTAPIDKALKATSQTTFKLVGSLTEVVVKRQKRGGKSISIVLDDGSGFISAFLNRDIVKGLDKTTAQEKVQSLYETGAVEVPAEIEEMATTSEFRAIEELETGQVYSVELTFRPGFDENPYAARVSKITKLDLADDGSLPVRLRLNKPKTPEAKKDQIAFIKGLAQKFPGTAPLYVAYKETAAVESRDAVYLDAIDYIKANGDEVQVSQEGTEVVETTALTGTVKKTMKRKVAEGPVREWPPPKQDRGPVVRQQLRDSMSLFESLVYRPTKFSVAKTQDLARAIEDKIGIENYDFGVFNQDLLDEY